MGLSFLGGLKGFADGVNAEAAAEQEYKLAIGKATGTTKANLALAAEADIAKRTKSLGMINYTDEKGNKKQHNITYLQSDASDVGTRNIDNITSIIESSNVNIGGKSVLEWINLSGDSALANTLVGEYGKYMHPIIQNSMVKADNGSFVLKDVYPFINDAFWNQQTSKMVRGKNTDSILPGAFQYVGNGAFNGTDTIFPAYSTDVKDYTKTYWNTDDSMQAALARKPETTEKDLYELAVRWNRGLEKPYMNNKDMIEAFLFGLTDSDKTIGGIDRPTALAIALDLKPILQNGFQDVMNSTQKRNALMMYIGNLADNDIYINDPQQISEIFGYYFENTWTDESTQEGYIGKTSFDKVAASMGIEKAERLLNADFKVTKPIQRIDRILELAGDAGKEGSLPMGAVRQITLFGRGAIELGAQAESGIGAIFAGAKDAAMAVINSDMFDGNKDDINKEVNRLTELSKTNYAEYEKLVQEYGTEEALEAAYSANALEPGQKETIDGTRDALIEYHTYLLAFEMAGAVQGGGDSRTISNRDVEMMRAAIRDRIISSGKDFVGVLREIRAELNGTLTVNRLWSHASSTRSIKNLKAAKLYEYLYNDMRRGDNPLRAFARKIARKPIEEIGTEGEQEKTDLVEKEVTTTEVPEIQFGPYDNLQQMATGLKQFKGFNDKHPMFDTFKKAADDAIAAGYTKEHFKAELGEGITSLFFPN